MDDILPLLISAQKQGVLWIGCIGWLWMLELRMRYLEERDNEKDK